MTFIKTVAMASAICALGAVPVFAQTEPAEGVEATQAAVDNEIVCKRIAEAGTRIKKRICNTAAVWQQIEYNAKREMNLMMDRNVVPPNLAN